MADPKPPEVRLNKDGTLDEVVAEGAFVHLEQMSGTSWFLSVAVGAHDVGIWFRSARKIEAYYEESKTCPK